MFAVNETVGSHTKLRRNSDTDLLNEAMMRTGAGGQARRTRYASARPPRSRAAGDRADPNPVPASCGHDG